MADIASDDAVDAGMLGCCPRCRANFAENVQPENLKILENGWKMAWIEISKS